MTHIWNENLSKIGSESWKWLGKVEIFTQNYSNSFIKIEGGRFVEEEDEARLRFGEKGVTTGCDEWGLILIHFVRVRDFEVEVEVAIFTIEGVYMNFYSIYIVSNVNSRTL